MAYRILTFLAACSLAAPVLAAQSIVYGQTVEDFEGYTPGTTTINFLDDFGVPSFGVLSGGTVAAATAGLPAGSGTQVYTGRSLAFSIDEIGISWPGVGALISGTADISVVGYAFNIEDGSLVAVDSLVIPAGTVLGFAQVTGDLSRVVFSSAETFAIDDLTLGLPGISGGIPEPASWALLIAGFTLTGAALRRRRTATA